MRIFEVIPMDQKPKVIQDASTELNFCCIECYQSAQQHYLQVYRSKWTEFKAIENWILLNKGPPHDQATLIALVKMLCMRAQDNGYIKNRTFNNAFDLGSHLKSTRL